MADRRRTSIKRIRVDKRKHLRNLAVKIKLKKILKNFNALVSTHKAEEAKALLPQVFAQLDKAAKKNILHSNTANRKKSRLALKLNKKA